MSFDTVSYIMGDKKGYGKGYTEGRDSGYTEGHESGYNEGYDDGVAANVITLTGVLTATDDGDGLITLTEETNG